ncbi:MAG: MT-A70 family methyltransferase [Roseomonas mucosa]|nr:MT-A70 family methyltransferase [Roseomonas mucosa]
MIEADPPWSFTTYSKKGWGKTPHAHYDCMSLADIKAMPVPDLAAPNAVLLLWATMPMIPEALEVMAAWGFKHKTALPWVKQSKTGRALNFGTGYIFRNCAELLLVGKRGKPPREKSRSERGVIIAPVREHSRKPDETKRKIEALWDGPYLELFARQSRPGWHGWGNQATRFDAPEMTAA